MEVAAHRPCALRVIDREGPLMASADTDGVLPVVRQSAFDLRKPDGSQLIPGPVRGLRFGAVLHAVEGSRGLKPLNHTARLHE